MALTSISGFGGFGNPFNGHAGPFEANSAAFLDAIAASNSTSTFHIPGYDVSKPFPGEPISGWTLSLTALDLSKLPNGYPIINGNRPTMLGHALQITAPESLLKKQPDGTLEVDAHESWGMCIWDFDTPPVFSRELWNNPENKPLNHDGSCKGFLSDECIAALEAEAKKSYNYRFRNVTRYGSFVQCGRLTTPEVCGENGPGNSAVSIPSYGGVPVRYLNGSVTQSDGWEFEDDRGVWYNGTEDLHTYWDSMVLNYWTMVTSMVNATRGEGEGESEGLVGVHCVAPNGVNTGKGFAFDGTVPGSVKEEEQKVDDEKEEKNAGGKITMSMGALALAVGVGCWLL